MVSPRLDTSSASVRSAHRAPRGLRSRGAIAVSLLLFGAPAFARGPRETPAAEEEARETAPEAALDRGRVAYARSDYDAVVATLRPLLYPTVQLGSDDEMAARKQLALAYYFLRDIPLAEAEFNALLQLDPGFALDRLVDPPKAIAFLDDIRRRNRERLEALAEQRQREEMALERERERHRREAEEAARRSRTPIIIERTVERHRLVYAFVPFGVGQLQNGDQRKGWAFFSSEMALAAASVGSFIGLYVNRTASPVVSYVPVMFGGAFWLVAAAGVVDALAHYQPVVVIEDGHPAPPPAPPAPHIGLAPSVGADGAGLTLQGVF